MRKSGPSTPLRASQQYDVYFKTMKDQTKALKKKAKKFFSQNGNVQCPAFPDEKVVFNSKGLSHLFYKGSRKTSSRSLEEASVRVGLLSRALKLLQVMPLAQEEFSLIDYRHRRCYYFAFEAVVGGRRIKVIVRKVGDGNLHFWSVIPAWRKTRGERVNAKNDLSKK